MPTGKGTGRRDVSSFNPCAGQHQVTVFALPGLTITSFKSSDATERGAPAGEHDGQQIPPRELRCQPGNGAPGLRWKPLGGSRTADCCPRVSWVCQGKGPSLLSPCAARGSPDPRAAPQPAMQH